MSARAASEPAGAVAVRDAATVMLVRDGLEGLEVLLLQRTLDSVFVPGAYVFPGGAVDPDDHADELAGRCRGLADVDASRLVGRATGGLSFWVAAVREAFEEAGVLLAYGPDGALVPLDRPAWRGRFLEHRRALDAGRRRLVDICRDEGLSLAVDSMRYFGHWTTPLGAPRRYDTRFFVAPAPPAQTPTADDRETIGDLWIRPAEALARGADGGFELIVPTVRSLSALDRFGSVAEVLMALDAAQTAGVTDGGPVMVPDHGGVRVALPGDPPVDEALTGAPSTASATTGPGPAR